MLQLVDGTSTKDLICARLVKVVLGAVELAVNELDRGLLRGVLKKDGFVYNS